MRVLVRTAVCALACACGATETGNPVVEQRLALTAHSSRGDVAVAAPASADGVRVDEAWTVIGDIRFVQAERCDDGPSQEMDIASPGAIDLVAQPAPIPFALDATGYCRVRVRLDRAEGDGAGDPAELEDHALLIAGERADGTPFVLRSRDQREVELRSRGEPFTLAQGRAGLILAFDVGRWLQGVDLAGAEPDAGGVIRIDDDGDRERLEVFEENVEAAMELFRDDDGDARLDDAETGAPLARGGP